MLAFHTNTEYFLFCSFPGSASYFSPSNYRSLTTSFTSSVLCLNSEFHFCAPQGNFKNPKLDHVTHCSADILQWLPASQGQAQTYYHGLTCWLGQPCFCFLSYCPSSQQWVTRRSLRCLYSSVPTLAWRLSFLHHLQIWGMCLFCVFPGYSFQGLFKKSMETWVLWKNCMNFRNTLYQHNLLVLFCLNFLKYPKVSPSECFSSHSAVDWFLLSLNISFIEDGDCLPCFLLCS